jgi:hypothetical protein
MRGFALALCAMLAACDFSAPEVTQFTPDDNAKLVGIGLVDIHVEFTDSSETTARLVEDGRELDELSVDCNDDTCTADGVWDNRGLEAGAHQIGVTLEDSHGNVSHAVHEVALQDVLEVTSLRVTNEVDDYGGLEIEVYAFSDSDLVGCAGSRQNLDIVDDSDVTYTTSAILIEPDGKLLTHDDMGSRAFRLEVWEDDDAPVCPVVPNPAANDVLGASTAHTADEWANAGAQTFGQVVELDVAWARPLRTDEEPGTDTPTGDWDNGWDNDWGGGGAGCAAGGSPGWALLLLVTLGLPSRYRSRSRACSRNRAGNRRG